VDKNWIRNVYWSRRGGAKKVFHLFLKKNRIRNVSRRSISAEHEQGFENEHLCRSREREVNDACDMADP
jgi:hypothetical protein